MSNKDINISTEQGDNITPSGKNQSSIRIKSRAWKVLVYPDSAPEDWKEILSEDYNLRFVVSPLHDKDKWSKRDEQKNPEHKAGETKKAHWHVLILFDGETSYNTVWNILQKINSPIPQKCDGSPSTFMRYMCHLDHKNKHQYNIEDMEAYGGAIIDLTNSADEQATLSQILEFLESSKINSLFQFFLYAKKNNKAWYAYADKHTNKLAQILGSKYQDTKKQNQEQSDIIDTTQLAEESLSEQQA